MQEFVANANGNSGCSAIIAKGSTTLSLMTLNLTTLSLMSLHKYLKIDNQNKGLSAFNFNTLIVVFLTVTLNVFRLNVVVPTVVAPSQKTNISPIDIAGVVAAQKFPPVLPKSFRPFNQKFVFDCSHRH